MVAKIAIWALLLAQLQIARVLAAVTFTNNDYYVHEGAPFTITWTGNRGPVTITLMNGPDADLQPVLVVVKDYEGEEYTWTPPATLPADSYELQIADAGSADYSPRFQYPAPYVATTSTESVGPTSSSLPTTTTTPTSEPTSPDSPSTNTGLSTAAIAAIATLGSLLGLALILFAFYICHRRRRHRRERVGFMAGYELPSSSTAGSPSTVTATTAMPMKIAGGMGSGGQGRVELPARDMDLVELSVDNGREGRYM